MKITQERLYQVRIKVSEKTSQALRAKENNAVTKSILSISQKFEVSETLFELFLNVLRVCWNL